MRVVADLKKCDGYANCVVAAPLIFDVDDEGLVVVLDERPAEEERGVAEEAVRLCPAQAIWIEEG